MSGSWTTVCVRCHTHTLSCSGTCSRVMLLGTWGLYSLEQSAHTWSVTCAWLTRFPATRVQPSECTTQWQQLRSWERLLALGSTASPKHCRRAPCPTEKHCSHSCARSPHPHCLPPTSSSLGACHSLGRTRIPARLQVCGLFARVAPWEGEGEGEGEVKTSRSRLYLLRCLPGGTEPVWRLMGQCGTQHRCLVTAGVQCQLP